MWTPCGVCCCFRQTPLMRLSEREHSCLHVPLHNNCQTLLSVLSLYIRQALDPHLWHGPRKLGRASGAGHSLLGARPLDPLVHMFNPSPGTHV